MSNWAQIPVFTDAQLLEFKEEDKKQRLEEGKTVKLLVLENVQLSSLRCYDNDLAYIDVSKLNLIYNEDC